MAETTGKQATRKAKAPKSVKVETGPIEADPIIELEGFTPDEVARLMRVRRKVAVGEYTDVTPEHRKLLFVQWLIEHDRLMS